MSLGISCVTCTPALMNLLFFGDIGLLPFRSAGGDGDIEVPAPVGAAEAVVGNKCSIRNIILDVRLLAPGCVGLWDSLGELCRLFPLLTLVSTKRCCGCTIWDVGNTGSIFCWKKNA